MNFDITRDAKVVATANCGWWALMYRQSRLLMLSALD